MDDLDALINTWADETMEEAWWAGMEVDLARLVRRAYMKGVQAALTSCPHCERSYERTTRLALSDQAVAWEKSVAPRVDTARRRGIPPRRNLP